MMQRNKYGFVRNMCFIEFTQHFIKCICFNGPSVKYFCFFKYVKVNKIKWFNKDIITKIKFFSINSSVTTIFECNNFFFLSKKPFVVITVSQSKAVSNSHKQICHTVIFHFIKHVWICRSCCLCECNSFAYIISVSRFTTWPKGSLPDRIKFLIVYK